MKTFFKPGALLILFFMSGNHIVFAQTPSSWYYENEFDLAIPLREKWTIEIGFGNRGLFTEKIGEESSGYKHQHLELNQFTHYSAPKNLILSLGLRYRFKELFDQLETDEFRMIEQIEMESVYSSMSLFQRFRLEQRFRVNTVHRMRYQIGFDKPINDSFSWEVSTEALYSVSAKAPPEAEQRFNLGLENSSFENLEVELNFEYRIEDYARYPGHEFFIITGVSLTL